jgi:tetratricopeptide (TPR) repeat protein
VLETWAAQYPNDYIPHNNVALNYMYFGRFEDARREAQRAAELSPNNASARDNLISAFIGMDRFDEAAQVVNDLERIAPDSPSVHFERSLLAFFRGDITAMEKEVDSTKGRPEEADALLQQAQFAALHGKLGEAEKFTLRAVELFKTQERPENASQSLISLAQRQALLGKCQQARQNATASLALSRGRISLSGAGLTFAACNDTAQAQALTDEMVKLYPADLPINLVVPSIKAILELNKGNGAGANQLLAPIRKYDRGLLVGNGSNFVSGHAYLQQKMGKEAAAEFEKIVSQRGIDPFDLERPLAHLGLARAALLMGDTSRARKEYQDFLRLWKDADQDLPTIEQFKNELSSLINSKEGNQ